MDEYKPLVEYAQQVPDLCFSGGSFGYIYQGTIALSGVITTLFGWLMLSYRGQLKQAESREERAENRLSEARTAMNEAITQRNEAVLRLNLMREQYGEFVESQAERQLLPPRRHRRLPPGAGGP